MKVYCIDYCVTGIGEIDWVDVFGKGREEMTLKNRVERKGIPTLFTNRN